MKNNLTKFNLNYYLIIKFNQTTTNLDFIEIVHLRFIKVVFVELILNLPPFFLSEIPQIVTACCLLLINQRTAQSLIWMPQAPRETPWFQCVPLFLITGGHTVRCGCGTQVSKFELRCWNHGSVEEEDRILNFQLWLCSHFNCRL